MSNLSEFRVYMKKPEEKNEENKRIIGYTRVSSKQQVSNYSIEEQEKEIREYSIKNGYDLIEIIGGTYESASGDFTRKEFKRLYENIKKSKLRPYAIAIKFINRFSRSGAGAIAIVEELVEGLGVHLIETSTGLTTETFLGKDAVFRKLLEARKENHERLERTIPGMKSLLKSGDWLGRAPFGYTLYGPRTKDFSRRREYQELVINEDGKILRQAWQWKLQGERDCVILRKMSDLGLTLDKRRLSDIWRNPLYCGVNTNSLLDEPQKGNWEPMVSEIEFWKVQGNLNPTMGAVYNTQTINDLRPLARFLICGKCGTPLTGYIVKNKNVHYYKCNVCPGVNMNANSTSRSWAEGLNDTFRALLQSVELKPECADFFKMQVEKMFNFLNAEAISSQKRLQKQLEVIEGKLAKLEDRYIYDDLDPEIYKRHKDKLEQEKTAFASKCKNVSGELSNHLKHLEKVALASQNISKRWGLGSYPVKDKIQRAVFPDGLIMDPDKREYLTNNINKFFLVRPEKSGDVENGVKKKSVKTPTCPVK